MTEDALSQDSQGARHGDSPVPRPRWEHGHRPFGHQLMLTEHPAAGPLGPPSACSQLPLREASPLSPRGSAPPLAPPLKQTQGLFTKPAGGPEGEAQLPPALGGGLLSTTASTDAEGGRWSTSSPEKWQTTSNQGNSVTAEII